MQKDQIDNKTIKNLEKKVKELEDQLLKKTEYHNKILCEQSKMAVLGEMLGNISHQWRQPLMELATILISMEANLKMQSDVDKNTLIDYIARSHNVMKYMSNTIDDFRYFFVKDKKKAPFKISDQIKKAVGIISTTLENKNIKLNIIVKDNPIIYVYQSEYSQVLINIITNAKDILIHRDIQDGLIEVKVYKKEQYCITEIIDNGGGISVEPTEKIFEPFFTNEKKGGSGAGLFISKLIVKNNMSGELKVQNLSNGAKFIVSLPIYSQCK